MDRGITSRQFVDNSYYVILTRNIIEAVLDYEYLTGARGEEVPKEIAIASVDSIKSFRFLPLTQ
jgi:hypothetical protein